MNKMIQTEFDTWYQGRNYSRKADKIYAILANAAAEKNIAEEWQQLFMEAVEIEQSAAFEKGFYTAVELLTRGERQ